MMSFLMTLYWRCVVPKIEGLTPTILVMNDSYYLPYALESLRGRFNRYVIYDAGSEDGTENIIDWFTETEDAEFFVRKLPFAVPDIQGCYRNSMLVEAETEWTFMVDADEVYHPDSLDNLVKKVSPGGRGEIVGCYVPAIRYGVVRRVEMATNLLHRYSDERTHHRLYRKDAYFTGTHPGEVPRYKQKESSEFHMDDVTCWHFHNALRSPLEGSVPKRLDRKAQGTYHPGELVPFDLLKELPILREPINNFPVSEDLGRLQHVASKM
jgi:glycosyltransferase involved in cell wall biosynthesis